MKHRFTALLCTACISFTGVYLAMPADIMTACADVVIDSGTCGPDLTWKLDDEGLLTIEGTGKMTASPWVENNSKKVKKVVISEGVTTINVFAFCGLTELSEISIPESIVSVGERAFYGCSSLEEISFPLNCSSIGRCAMGNCKSLRKVTILNSDISILGQWSAGDLQEEYPHFGISNNKLLFVRDESIEDLTKFIPKEPAFFNGTIYSYPNSRMKEWAKDYCEFKSLDTTGLKKIVFDPNGCEEKMQTCYAKKGQTFVLPKCRFDNATGRELFAYWQIGEKKYHPGESITVDSDVTITTVWEAPKWLGDPNSDEKIDSSDASFILAAYTSNATGGEVFLTPEEEYACDVNNDKKIDSKDASAILSYYSYRATGGDLGLKSFLTKKET